MRWTGIFVFAAVLAAQNRDGILQSMDGQAERWGKVSRQIWEFAEVGHKEHKSSKLLQDQLKEGGFTIQAGVADMPTAFVASWGSGKPVIGILGEFDALPGLSQKDVPQKDPRIAGEGGHGCGHNLFGAASAFAATAVKEWMAANKVAGTIRFYGTPAEEGGGGKIYMSRAGLFNDVDVVLAWHPGSANIVSMGTSLANITAKFRYRGMAAHAAGAPDKGRSALDALLLASHCVEMLREHVPQETRIHYMFTKAGEAPNVVPDLAEGFFYARSPSMPVLDNVWERINKCAQAAALGTETKLETEFINSVYNLLSNEPLARLLDRNLRAVGGIQYTAEEKKFAEELMKTYPPTAELPLGSEAKVQALREERGGGGSTDVADVSWLVPTAQFSTATFVPGTPGHSWQSTACAGSSIGRKGMVNAAKVLALSAADLFRDGKLIADAKADFDKRRAGHVYKSRVPPGQKPPLNYRDK